MEGQPNPKAITKEVHQIEEEEEEEEEVEVESERSKRMEDRSFHRLFKLKKLVDLPLQEKCRRSLRLRRSKRQMYQLSTKLQEKEDSVLTQKVSRECRGGKYSDTWTVSVEPNLSEDAQKRGRQVFVPIAKKHVLPERPFKSGRKGFYIEDSDVLGMRGVSGKDLALVWHMIMIPSARIGVDTNDEIRLGWVFDLEPEHVEIVEKMREQAIEFVQKNREYFVLQWSHRTQELGGLDIFYWLREENLQFGFHLVPSVGYLHMHVLVGPVTEFGFSAEYKSNWVSADVVLDTLRRGQTMAETFLAC